MNKRLHFTFYHIILILLSFFSSQILWSQRFPTPEGAAVIRKAVFTAENIQYRLSATAVSLYTSKYWQGIGWSKNKEIYSTPPSRKIIDLSLQFGETGDKRTVLILLDDGTCISAKYNSKTQLCESKLFDTPPVVSNPQPKKLISATSSYLLISNKVWQNKKDGKGWIPDTNGISRLTVNDICYFDLQTIAAATSKGIFTLTEGSNQWNRMTSFDSTLNCSLIFNSRGSKFYAATSSSKGTFVSVNSGATWNRDTAGLGNANVNRFGDDVYGTVYAKAGNTSSVLYRRTSVGTSWERIDTNFRNDIGASPTFNDFGGDSTLETATNYGIYTSLNSGTNSVPSFTGIMSEDISSLIFLDGEKAVTSTSFGIYTQASSGSDWIKRYPATGFSGQRLLRRDALGVLFFQESSSGSNLTHQPNILKSTDGGVTWNYDTLGIYSVPASSGFFTTVFYVDELQNQHFGLSASGTAPIRVYSRAPSSPWNLDTTGSGFTPTTGQQFKIFGTFGSDAKSNLYLSTLLYSNNQFLQGDFFVKQFVGGTWQADTVGFNNNLISAMTVDKKGKMFIGSIVKQGLSTLLWRDTDGWKTIPVPPAGATDVRSMAFDSTGALFVNYTPIYYGINRGVYVTDDFGVTWGYAGLDSISVRGLMGKGNSMYAYTDRGAFKLNPAPLKLPVLTLSIKNLNFGQVSSGYQKDTVVQVKNTGTDTLRVSNITISNNSFSVANKIFNVAPSGSFDLTVSFKPSVPGVVSSALKFVSNAFPDSIKVQGEGIDFKYPKMLLSNDNIDFGEVEGGKSKDSVVLVYNIGDDTLKITDGQSNSTSFTPMSYAMVILPQDSAEFHITFSPKKNDVNSGRIIIRGNAGNDTVFVTGIGKNVNVPKLILSDKTINFGKVDIDKFKDTTIVISNEGTDTLKIINIIATPNIFSASKGNAVILVGDTAHLNIRFTPTSATSYNGRVRFISNSPDDSVTLAGLGMTPISVEELLFDKIGLTNTEIFPNPFEYDANINFQINTGANIKIEAFDIIGNDLVILANQYFESGNYTIPIKISDFHNSVAGSCIFLKFTTEYGILIKKVTLLR